MRVAFLGTPDFAIPSLCMLYDEGHDIAVFTQPDRKKGRGGKLAMPPIKEKALELCMPVYQFEKISEHEGVSALKSFAPDLMVTAAYGQILTQEILDIPMYGCINVHASLLPEYRGPAPIQAAVIDGKRVTGITTMMTALGLDTGDILLAKSTEVGENETSGELFARLAVLGADVLRETLHKLQDGTLTRTPQDSSRATRCRMIKKEHGKIDFTNSAEKIHNLVRGLNPSPCAYAYWDDSVIKIHSTLVHNDIQTDAEPGTCITASSKLGLFVATGEGVLEIVNMQLPGGRIMTAKEVLNGKHFDGAVLR